MGRKILAIMVGITIAFLLIALIEMAGHRLYPTASELDLSDPAAMSVFIQNLPAGAFVFVLAAYALGTLVGGYVACRIARVQPLWFAGIIAAVVLTATITNLVMIPHPLWFSITSILLILVMSLLAARLGKSR